MKPRIDRIDIEILRLLQNDARLAIKQIAAAVHLAPSSVHDRLRRLWREGVLTGTHAAVDAQALGVGLEALLMIELSKHERSAVDRFMDEAVEIPEVRSTHLITGRYDLVVHVVARDTRHLKDLALDRFTSRPEVTRIETSIIYETRRRHALPMLADVGDASDPSAATGGPHR
ncbi:MAG: Lrp/AsnC family transcriptional regulator [Rhodocyclaceae bacterium]|nr:Lrp/AsnC family transcriptional regulator [Rhodocyclaceae bacterium]